VVHFEGLTYGTLISFSLSVVHFEGLTYSDLTVSLCGTLSPVTENAFV